LTKFVHFWYNAGMEATKARPTNNLKKYEAMLKPNRSIASFMRLAGLITKKEAEQILASTKKARAQWR